MYGWTNINKPQQKELEEFETVSRKFEPTKLGALNHSGAHP